MVELLLSNIFKHEQSYKIFDCIVCWKVDIELNEMHKLVDGVEHKLTYEKSQWLLKYGSDKVIPVIELSEIIKSFC